MKSVGWLASVTSVDEARLALAAGADILDAKNPQAGALGALPMHVVLGIVEVAGERATVSRPGVGEVARESHARVSATLGDLTAMDPLVLRAAALDMAATGVDLVKIGLFPAATLGACIDGMAAISARHKLVGVVLADRLLHDRHRYAVETLVPRLAAAGWYGVMLDTADKRTGGLLRHRDARQLASFVALAHRHGLHCGLAGSLRAADIPALRAIGPDLLGFRGALCHAAQRTAGIHPQSLAAVARAMRSEPAPAALLVRGHGMPPGIAIQAREDLHRGDSS